MTKMSIASAYMRGFCSASEPAFGDGDRRDGHRTRLARPRLEEPPAAGRPVRTGARCSRLGLHRNGIAVDDLDGSLAARVLLVVAAALVGIREHVPRLVDAGHLALVTLGVERGLLAAVRLPDVVRRRVGVDTEQ